jgi:Protein of unknown function (DUF3237)
VSIREKRNEATEVTGLEGSPASARSASPGDEIGRLGDIRSTLKTHRGALLCVRSQSVRHGSAEVLARVARSDDVDAREYTFRAWTQVETAAAELDWLNEGLFIGVGGRQGEESPTTPTPSVDSA